jgi:hypothetical protein
LPLLLFTFRTGLVLFTHFIQLYPAGNTAYLTFGGIWNFKNIHDHELLVEGTVSPEAYPTYLSNLVLDQTDLMVYRFCRLL